MNRSYSERVSRPSAASAMPAVPAVPANDDISTDRRPSDSAGGAREGFPWIHLGRFFADSPARRRRIHPAMMLAAGVLVLAVGIWLLVRAWRSAPDFPDADRETGGIPQNSTELNGIQPPVNILPTETDSDMAATSGDTSIPEETTGAPAGGEMTGEPVESQPVGTDALVTEPATDHREPPAEPETRPTERPDSPAGTLPIIGQDLSCREQGSGYTVNTAGVPLVPFEGRLFGDRLNPAVLIVHSHPGEGYSADEWVFDPSVTPAATVVDVGTALTARLQERGVPVLHLWVKPLAGESAGDTFRRAGEEVVYYCRMYPDIGLVLDLRRSGEMAAGGILRTEGQWQGRPAAQAEIAVNARDEWRTAQDYAAALALRRLLWAEEPRLSRPVRVRDGHGLADDLSGVVRLTLTVGASGNTWAEVDALLDPLADALAGLLSGQR